MMRNPLQTARLLPGARSAFGLATNLPPRALLARNEANRRVGNPVNAGSGGELLNKAREASRARLESVEFELAKFRFLSIASSRRKDRMIQ